MNILVGLTGQAADKCLEQFAVAMNDDLNTPRYARRHLLSRKAVNLEADTFAVCAQGLRRSLHLREAE